MLKIDNIHASIEGKDILKGFSLEVDAGEVHAIMGPNGSGKSTTIRILLGLLRKTSGNVVMLDKDPWRDAVELHRRLAYVPGEVNLWPNLSGGECIDLLSTLRGGLDKKRKNELLELFELDPTRKFRTYSKGNRQKVALVAALASDVELYLFDEPTSGLDPLMESVFQAQVKELKMQGKTVLLSSHILAEVEALCDKVTIIREGKAVENGTLDELRHLHRINIAAQTDMPISEIDKIKGVYNIKKTSKEIIFEVDPKHLDEALEVLSKHNVYNLKSAPPSLEQMFLRHYDDNSAVTVKTNKEQ
jgi:ABC-2 type transport system ATP-binding protein